MKTKHFQLSLKDEIKNQFIVTGVYPDYEWKDGKPTEKLKGYKYRTVCPSAGYDETIVKIEQTKPSVDPDTVETQPVLVSFEQLEFKSFYNNTSGKLEYTAKATGLKVLTQK